MASQDERTFGGQCGDQPPIPQLTDGSPHRADADVVIVGQLPFAGQHRTAGKLTGRDPGRDVISDSRIDVRHPYGVPVPRRYLIHNTAA
jgi:hypothetical protein